MLYFSRLMRRFLRPLIAILLSVLLALLSTALSYSAPPAIEAGFNDAALFLQVTSTPPAQDRSEIGSTDGIVIMGILIALIVIVPLLLRRETWLEER